MREQHTEVTATRVGKQVRLSITGSQGTSEVLLSGIQAQNLGEELFKQGTNAEAAITHKGA